MLRELAKREIRNFLQHPIYIVCMVLLPLFVTVFFTTLMDDGQPVNMPIGVVDLDNTSTTRKLTRMVDALQSTEVVGHYPSVDEARAAIQRNEIYGFVLFPRNLTSKMISGRQPRMSFYYTNTSLTAGALVYKEMKTMCSLASAGVGQAMMRAKGFTSEQMRAFLMPVSIDLHTIGNPWVSYNIFLCSMLLPGMMLLFIFLITVYALGTELKFGTSKEWLATAGNNIVIALIGKMLPYTVIFFSVFSAIMFYIFGILDFPAPGGYGRILLISALSVLSAQGFAVFVFGVMPSLRLAMSVCSLWAVLSFSMVGSAFPVFAMDAPLQSLAWLFPLRHYYMIYQLCIFNTYPLSDVSMHIGIMIIFTLLPLLTIKRIRKAMTTYEYQA